MSRRLIQFESWLLAMFLFDGTAILLLLGHAFGQGHWRVDKDHILHVFMIWFWCLLLATQTISIGISFSDKVDKDTESGVQRQGEVIIVE